MNKRPTIYHYTDYRRYLDAYYSNKKNQEAGYSFRAMSTQLGFTSPNFMKLVIDGKRNLGPKVIEQVINGLELKRFESEYFRSLVAFSRAKNEPERNSHFGDIARLRSGKLFSRIESTHYRFYTNWYNCVIRELVVGQNAETIDYAEIARKVVPHIHHKQAEQSVEMLRELNYISVSDDGTFQQSSPILTTDNEVTSYAIKRYHQTMIQHGMDSIDEVDRSRRDISAVTMRVSEEGFNAIKERLQQFREELLHIIHNDTNTDRVAQFNMQLFPVSDFDNCEVLQ